MDHDKVSNWIAVSGFLLAVTIIASWGIDISITALTNNGVLTNGFFLSNPMKVYHVCLYMIIVFSFSHFLLTLHISFKLHHRESEKKEAIHIAEKTQSGSL